MFYEPLAAIDWDGYTLCLNFSAKNKIISIALEINGIYFADVPVDQNASARFTFKFSPSGEKLFSIMPRVSRNGIPIIKKPLQFQIGKIGIFESESMDFSFLSPLSVTYPEFKFYTKNYSPKIKIIVPIYNATESVKTCIKSLVKHTRNHFEILLIDDASTDSAIKILLDEYRNQSGIRVLSNAENWGFTRTVNRGLQEAEGFDVVILNADTEVGPKWLQGLIYAAYSKPEIGTATAVSDNAGAFSVPELEQENPLPQQWNFEQCARACWQQVGLAYPELPTGNGFCMYIKSDVIKQIGHFDAEAFPYGYGEENDFCMRAQKAGYRHVIAGNVLVRHARSQSFGIERRQSLGQSGMTVLRQRYPAYEAQVGATLFSFERLVLNWRIRFTWQNADKIYPDYSPRPRILFLQCSQNFHETLPAHFELLRLLQEKDEWKLERYAKTGWYAEQHTKIDEAINSGLIGNWLVQYAIEIVCISKTVEENGLLSPRNLPFGVVVCWIDSDQLTAGELMEKINECV